MRAIHLFSLSLFLHAALLFSFQRALPNFETKFILRQKEILQKKDDRLEFQFVESPPQKTIAHKPRFGKKISDRDALNQDLSKNKSNVENSPAAQNIGRADQLAQRRGASSQKRISKTKPSEAQQKQAEDSRSHQSMGVTEEVKPAQEPKEEIHGAPGRDKIITQEVARLKSGGSRLYGMTSFEATGSGMGVYIKHLKEKIWVAWFPYLAFQYPMDYRGANAVVSFTLDTKGEIKKIKILESKGSPAFATYCLEAVKKAGGFGELPKEILALLGKEELEIKFGFNYR